MEKWIPIKENFELKDIAIVTRQIKGPKGKNISDVTIGYPGWNLKNNTVAYMPLPSNIVEDSTIWKSEYNGDVLPKKDKGCIVQLQNDMGKFKILDSYFLVDKSQFLRIPSGWEVIAWMDYPKPYSA